MNWHRALTVCLLVFLAQTGAQTTVSYIYSNGELYGAFRSWSWGLSSLSFTSPDVTGRTVLCLSAQPFGALSLKSSMAFNLDGSVLGMYIRGSGYTTAAALGTLEFQLESSSPSRYAITASLTLAQILEVQAAAEGSNAAQLLAGIAAGNWVPVKVNLSSFTQLAPNGSPDNAPGIGGAPFKADRLTIGSCLQV
jgi:hypothetical protein